ncbi:MAG: HNH endonuclease [Rhizobium sp.]|nr:HNH endonuclease [Rhizobium sp.]
MNLIENATLGFEIGGLYSRREHIHSRFGGQMQGGISTPKNFPYIFLFTGEVGQGHGYRDRWETDNRFHYYGEGQSEDMTYTGGNRAILRHDLEGKRLFVFRMLGHGRPYRFEGEFKLDETYEHAGATSRSGQVRKAIVFVLKQVNGPADGEGIPTAIADAKGNYLPGPASAQKTVEVRTRQWLFRRRVADMEKGCRLTGVSDLRFLRASHMKPWSKCDNDAEKLDGNNGLLLSPNADLLFDRGWITFEDSGRLVRTDELPAEVADRIGLDLRPGRKCGAFRDEQLGYLDFHREFIFGKKYAAMMDPLGDLQPEPD